MSKNNYQNVIDNTDTICAIATAPGRGGVGIIRLSGPKAFSISQKILKKNLSPRTAIYGNFYSKKNEILDQGISLYFPKPHSFTGEDVVELQAHGGPVILDMLIHQSLHWGARLAKPGEFSERAFLNDKIDLTQAEAIADLINASSEQAAKQAINSLQGEFSKHIHSLVEQCIQLRMYVESAIDFPEEEIDFLSDGHVKAALIALLENTSLLLGKARQGVLIKEGMKVVLAGRPNAGKSSLLNCLAEQDIAIVTDIAGTTRDVLKEHIHIDGMPLHIIDTAGLREDADTVEKIGIERAWSEINDADRILLMIDASDQEQCKVESHWPEFFTNPNYVNKLCIIYNKIDLEEPNSTSNNIYTPTDIDSLRISARNNEGIDALRTYLTNSMGLDTTLEGRFSARRRHIDALERTHEYFKSGQYQLEQHTAGELLAEDLRCAQECLSEITGEFSADELLGKIFSSFCIGK